MFRVRGERRRKSAARFAVESLEERAVPTASAAAVDIQYLRAITHLNTLLQRRVTHIQGLMTRRVAKAEARYEATLDRSAQQIAHGPAQARQAGVAMARASARADAQVDQVAATVDRQLGGFTAQFNRQLGAVTGHFSNLGRVFREANPYFAANFHNALAAVDTGIPAEVQVAQGAVEAASGPVQSAVAQAATSGAATGAKAEAAAGRLSATGAAQRAGEKAVVARFWDQYYQSFNQLRAEMAAIASAELPPVHLGGGGGVTGPQGVGSRRGSRNGYLPGAINGTGTGTVTFTGLAGASGTTGTGFGIESGVSGTGGTGTGNGTTTITGNGTNTTGVGSTVTAGQGPTGGVGGTIVGGSTSTTAGGTRTGTTIIPIGTGSGTATA